MTIACLLGSLRLFRLEMKLCYVIDTRSKISPYLIIAGPIYSLLSIHESSVLWGSILWCKCSRLFWAICHNGVRNYNSDLIEWSISNLADWQDWDQVHRNPWDVRGCLGSFQAAWHSFDPCHYLFFYHDLVIELCVTGKFP